MVYAAIFALLGLVALDQAVKYWTVQTFAAPMAGFTATADPALPGIPGLVELTRIHNYGAAWSSFSRMRWALVAVTSVERSELLYKKQQFIQFFQRSEVRIAIVVAVVLIVAVLLKVFVFRKKRRYHSSSAGRGGRRNYRGSRR